MSEVTDRFHQAENDGLLDSFMPELIEFCSARGWVISAAPCDRLLVDVGNGVKSNWTRKDLWVQAVQIFGWSEPGEFQSYLKLLSAVKDTRKNIESFKEDIQWSQDELADIAQQIERGRLSAGDLECLLQEQRNERRDLLDLEISLNRAILNLTELLADLEVAKGRVALLKGVCVL